MKKNKANKGLLDIRRTMTLFSLIMSAALCTGIMAGCETDLIPERPLRLNMGDPKDDYTVEFLTISELAGQVESKTCSSKIRADIIDEAGSNLTVDKEAKKIRYYNKSNEEYSSGFTNHYSKFTVTSDYFKDISGKTDEKSSLKISCETTCDGDVVKDEETDEEYLRCEYEFKPKDLEDDKNFISNEFPYKCKYPCAGGINIGAYWRNLERSKGCDIENDRATEACSRFVRVGNGDNFGVSPAFSSQFNDLPPIDMLNALYLDVDALGNHNFDGWLNYLDNLMSRSKYHYSVSNLINVPQNISNPKLVPYYIKDMDGEPTKDKTDEPKVNGIPVAIIGALDTEAFRLVFPGKLGTLEVDDYCSVVYTMQDAFEKGARAFFIIAHISPESTKTAKDSQFLYHFLGTILNMDGESSEFFETQGLSELFSCSRNSIDDSETEKKINQAIFNSIIAIMGTAEDSAAYLYTKDNIDFLLNKSSIVNHLHSFDCNSNDATKIFTRKILGDVCVDKTATKGHALWFFQGPSNGESTIRVRANLKKSSDQDIPEVEVKNPLYEAEVSTFDLYHTAGKGNEIESMFDNNGLPKDEYKKYCDDIYGKYPAKKKDENGHEVDDNDSIMASTSIVEVVKYWSCRYYDVNPNTDIFVMPQEGFVYGTNMIRTFSTQLGNLVSTVIARYVNLASEVKGDITLMNSGSIRAGLSGSIKASDISTMLPYQNFVNIVGMNEREIAEVLEFGIQSTKKKASEFGGFLQVDGIRFSYLGRDYYKEYYKEKYEEHKSNEFEEDGFRVSLIELFDPKPVPNGNDNYQKTIVKENVIYYVPKTSYESADPNNKCDPRFVKIEFDDNYETADENEKKLFSKYDNKWHPMPKDWESYACVRSDIYNVITNDYLVNGGDGFSFPSVSRTSTNILLSTALVQYLSNERKNGSDAENMCQIVNDSNCLTMEGYTAENLSNLTVDSRINSKGFDYEQTSGVDWGKAENRGDNDYQQLF